MIFVFLFLAYSYFIDFFIFIDKYSFSLFSKTNLHKFLFIFLFRFTHLLFAGHKTIFYYPELYHNHHFILIWKIRFDDIFVFLRFMIIRWKGNFIQKKKTKLSRH